MVPARRVGGDGQRSPSARRAPPAPPSRPPSRPSRPSGRAGAPGWRGVAPAQHAGRDDAACPARVRKAGPDLEQRACPAMPRAALRPAASARVATGVGPHLVQVGGDRVADRSAGSHRRRTAPPARAAMKLNVTHSSSPAAASVRRASAARTWRGVSVGARHRRPPPAARPAARCRGRAGAAPPRPGRLPARRRRSRRRRSARAGRSRGSDWIERDRRRDVVAPGRHARPSTRSHPAPHARSRAVPARSTASSAGTSAPPRPASRAKRSVARALPGRLGAGRDDLARLAAAQVQDHARSPPRARPAAAPGRCRARSAAGRRRRSGGAGRSAPPRTGSNSAHSMNTAVVASVAAGRLAAHHAGQRLHAGGVGDHAILGVAPCIRGRSARRNALAGAGPQRQHAARRPCRRRTRAAAGRGRR